MASDRPRFNRRGKQVKKKPRIKMTDVGMRLNDPPNKKNKDKESVKIVPGFKGLIKKRKELIN